MHLGQDAASLDTLTETDRPLSRKELFWSGVKGFSYSTGALWLFPSAVIRAATCLNAYRTNENPTLRERAHFKSKVVGAMIGYGTTHQANSVFLAMSFAGVGPEWGTTALKATLAASALYECGRGIYHFAARPRKLEKSSRITA